MGKSTPSPSTCRTHHAHLEFQGAHMDALERFRGDVEHLRRKPLEYGNAHDRNDGGKALAI
jgi:aromatic ring-cleaving dioxygenase